MGVEQGHVLGALRLGLIGGAAGANRVMFKGRQAMELPDSKAGEAEWPLAVQSQELQVAYTGCVLIAPL